MTPSLHPRQLAGLVAVADHRHLGRAADALQVTPRALSRALRELERETGETLISCGERTVKLTARGERIAGSARAVLEALEGFEAIARADARTVRVAHVANSGTLSTLLDRLLEGLPWLRPEEQVMTDARQLQALGDHRLDIAVCCAPDPLPGEFEARLLRHDPLVAAGGERGAPLLAGVYGSAWPAFDACADAYERVLGRPLQRVAVPAGSGRELASLMRHAGARRVVVAESTLDGTSVPRDRLASGMQWRLIWRRDDPSPAVRQFVPAALLAAADLGWLDPRGEASIGPTRH